MSEMVRKQIYITKRQKDMLKRLSEARGISEAEIIRQAIDRETWQTVRQGMAVNRETWEQARQLMLDIQALDPIKDQVRGWMREEIYEDRLSRYGDRSD